MAAYVDISCRDARLDSTHLPALMQILGTLLRDRSPLSIGAVAVAFNAICPTRLDLLHQQYRRLCRVLGDADEWGQVQLLDLLSRYARVMLRAPSVSHLSSHGLLETYVFGFVFILQVDEAVIDSDLQLLLDSAGPLFHSRNAAVCLSLLSTLP